MKPTDPSRLGIYMLDVGQGDCTIVVTPTGDGDEPSAILFDCADAYVAERFVANHEIGRLEAVVASHLDIDHIRGLLPFLRNYFARGGKVQSLLLALDRVPASNADVNIHALVEQAIAWGEAPPHEGFTLEDPRTQDGAPKVLASGADWQVEIVLPTYDMRITPLLTGVRDPNRVSAVLRVVRAGTAVLIGGDAPLSAWQRLDPALVPAAVLRTPHHGGIVVETDDGDGWEALSKFYSSVGARASVISVGTNNGHQHPVEGHLSALRPERCRIVCTQMTSRCHPHPHQVREHALARAAGVEWPYRHWAKRGHPGEPGQTVNRPKTEVPCAGSVVAWIDDSGQLDIEPGSGEHGVVVDRALSPKCRPIATS